MAFRKVRDDWAEFLRQRAEELIQTGLPESVLRDRQRFFSFLDHGFDQWGWAKSHHDFFDARFLTEAQIEHLADFVARQFGEPYCVLIGSRWQRQSVNGDR
jgi:hypothetical protein